MNPYCIFMRWPLRIRIGILSLLLLMPCTLPNTAFAADDLFQFENTHWMSFERYKDKTKNTGNLPVNEIAGEAQAATPAEQASDQAPDENAAAVVAPPSLAPQVAAPARPVNIPVMPGVNKGFHMLVNSTEEEKPPVAQITNLEDKPTVILPQHNWQTPKEAARHAESDEEAEDENRPLDVRMSYLPNSKVAPIPSPEYKSNHGRRPAMIAKAKEPEKKADDPAACAAIDAYKKRQLEAIQGDRQTLADLQKAISDLGLQKQLNFMTDGGAMNQADTSSVQMDMPPDLSVPVKN